MFVGGPGGGGGALHGSVVAKINASRSSGVMNLRGESLTEVPAAVYKPEIRAQGGKWWEVAELVQVVLAHNELNSLPQQLGEAVTVTLLDVSHNTLSELPGTLSKLTELKLLDVSHNQLSNITPSIAALPSLAQLNCSNNKLTILPANLGANQPRLGKLEAAGNLLSDLPEGLASASALTYIDLERNALKRIPDGIVRNMAGLVDLNLSYNQIGPTLPEGFGCLTSLKLLNLRYNQLVELPAALSGCVSLVEIHVGHNKIERIAGELGNLPAVKIVDLSNNSLKSITAGICKWQLMSLDLTNNDLGGLPPELGTVTTLRKLLLDGNPLRTIRRELVSGPTSNLLNFLKMRMPVEDSGNAVTSPVRSGNLFGADEVQLAAEAARKLKTSNSSGEMKLKGLGLAEIPAEVWEAVGNLENLDISDNKIANLSPDAFQGAAILKTLVLRNSGLKVWPLPLQEMCLPSLMALNVARNPISTIPNNAFASCSATLRELDMSGIPAAGKLAKGTLACLKSLQRLSLSMTSSEVFPQDVFSLPSLSMLDLSNNTITFVPDSITLLTNLCELNLMNNNITALPPKLGLMHPTLKSLMLEGNILKTIRRPILEKGTPALLEYLAARIPF